MKVLMCAFACRPDQGSESAAGWEFVRLAAEKHDVWVLTDTANQTAIESARGGGPHRARFHYVDVRRFPAGVTALPYGAQSYYFAWQRAVRSRAIQLHRRVGFDLVHHVTYATDWGPAGVLAIDGVPAVWGPVGGATGMPWSQWRWIGWRGIVQEAARGVMTTGMRAHFGRAAARRADVTLAQNDDVRTALGRWSAAVETLPNVVLEPAVSHAPRPAAVVSARRRPWRRALFVGRLIHVKGLRLAVAALAEPPASDWRLEILGDGREADPARRLAARLGVAHRVSFRGTVSRAEVLAALDTADALLAPSLHEGSGFAVAEAVAHGCPVVCLDRGGPAVLVDDASGIRVPVSRTLPADLAKALSGVGGRCTPSDRWSRATVRAHLDRIYRTATGGGEPATAEIGPEHPDRATVRI